LTGPEIENSLQTMVILTDTREQPSDRAQKRFKSFECPYRRQKLDFGDYSAEFLLVDGRTVRVNAAIERKMSLEELSSCFTRDRDRFRREFERAQQAGASMYLLVENATWENLINGKYKTKFNKKAFLASLTAWIARYDLKPVFCKAETSGRLIKEILYREMKQRLEAGEYG
jgi:ERCC4-type nuclease